MAVPVGGNPQRLTADRLNQFQVRQSSINANGIIRGTVVPVIKPQSNDPVSVSAQRAMTPPPALPPRDETTEQLKAPIQVRMEKPALPPRPNANQPLQAPTMEESATPSSSNANQQEETKGVISQGALYAASAGGRITTEQPDPSCCSRVVNAFTSCCGKSHQD